MTYQLTVSPSISPDALAGWNLFNTWLQKTVGENVHLALFDSFEAQRQAIVNDKIDIIFANPFDAALLARDKGFLPIAKPSNQRDEAIIAVSENSGITKVEDLSAGARVRSTDAPHVKTMGMIMLEPANLNADNIDYANCDTYVVVAKEILRGNADVGIFLADSYNRFSPLIQKQLTPLVTSNIELIHHALMLSPKLQAHQETLTQALVGEQNPLGQTVLESLQIERWDTFETEDMEFMIDLISTLTS